MTFDTDTKRLACLLHPPLLVTGCRHGKPRIINTMATSTERARRHKDKLRETGLVQINIWVPAAAVSSFNDAAEKCRSDFNLAVARVVDSTTGRLAGIKSGAGK